MNSREEINNIPTQISEAQLEKLKLEIEELKRKDSWQQKILSFLPLSTITIAICGLWYNFHQFSTSLETQNIRERQSRLDEFRKPFLQKRLDLYIDAINTASTIVALDEESEERKKAELRFIELYTGSLHLVADEKFSQAKIDFVMCLRKGQEIKYSECQSDPTRHNALHNYSVALARIARESIFESWQVENEKLLNKK